MPPRKDTSTTDEPPPSLTDQFAQLIQVTTQTALTTSDINTQLLHLVQATSNLNAKLDTQTETTARLVNHIAQLTDPDKPEPPKPIFHHAESSTSTNPNPHPPKITLPLFDGSNPLDWIFQAENYFTYYNIPENR